MREREKGKNITDFKVGDRVYPYPRLVTGDPRRAGIIGGFSECIRVPLAREGVELYRINEAISDREASLIEPFTVGCRAARRSVPVSGENAIVFGAGTIGVAAAISLKYFGCGKVMVCDHSDFRLGIVSEHDYLFHIKGFFIGEAMALANLTGHRDVRVYGRDDVEDWLRPWTR